MLRQLVRPTLLILALAACSDSRRLTAPLTPDGSSLATDKSDGAAKPANLRAGAVFAMTNQTSGNAIAAFQRDEDGSLTFVGNFPTGGLGFGAQPDPLRSQGSLLLVDGGGGDYIDDHDDDGGKGDDRGELLFAANAGSNDISVLSVEKSKLTLLSRTPSGGVRPTSVTVHENLLYVLNAGSGTINGFRIGKHGTLTPIPGAVRPTTGNAGGDPTEVSFSPDGRLLAVTDKSPNIIDTYVVDERGMATGPLLNISSGATPFGFAFDQHQNLVVAEANHGGPALGAASSYSVSRAGVVTPVSSSVRNGQTATCWLVITTNGRYVYTSNAGSSDISSYLLRPNGALTLLDPIAATTDVGSSPVDLALTFGSRFLYVLNDVTGTVDGYRIGPDGSLTRVATVGGLPPNAQGLAAK